jgi:predicted metalloprotease
MEWEGREESQNVEDRRAMGGGRKMAIGGGIGGIIILILGLVLGVNPQLLQMFLGGGGQQVQMNDEPGQVDPAQNEVARFTKVIFGDTERIWDEQFRKMGKTYRKPTLVIYTGVVESACGTAESAVGPFYCPGDHKVYIDLDFYRDMERKLNAPGEFARAYVIAHEVGHHVQFLLGYSQRADEMRRSGNKRLQTEGSVRLELQADYLAGVWAHYGQEKYKFLGKGDLESAINAAFQIGDDRLQKKARGYVVPDSFTHGSSKQRMRWFREGFDTGDINRARLLFELPYEKL